MRYSRVLLLAAILGCGSEHRPSVTIATTTSFDGSGLLKLMRQSFEAQTGIALNAVAVGSGRALRMAATGDVKVAITHDPDSEAIFVARYHPAIYRQFMWSDFVIVGPREDPARVGTAQSARDAFRIIHEKSAAFLSRNDQSGTHSKELALWRDAGVSPSSNPHYLPIGQSMALLLRSADQLQAYALTDRATFDQLAPNLRLSVLFEGDPKLKNVYSIILMRGSDSEPYRSARNLTKWILGPEGRRIVESFEVRGRREMHWIDQR